MSYLQYKIQMISDHFVNIIGFKMCVVVIIVNFVLDPIVKNVLREAHRVQRRRNGVSSHDIMCECGPT